MNKTPNKNIGVSSCLLGNKVRYDGDDQYQAEIKALESEFKLIPFCPEMDIGLGVPREKIQLVKRGDKIHCVDQATYQKDYTQDLIQSCENQLAWLKQISGYIFKTKSPSCGLSKVKTDIEGEILTTGQGIFSTRFKQLFPKVPTIEEDEFKDPDLRKRFLQQVRNYQVEKNES